MPVLKSLSFTALHKNGNDPVQFRRAKFIAKLEEQKLLLTDPNHVRTVQRWTKINGERPGRPIRKSTNASSESRRQPCLTGSRRSEARPDLISLCRGVDLRFAHPALDRVRQKGPAAPSES
jgi:hypothetical protein